ncbi:allophanate hydrolase subunit 1 [Pseudarthrobacter sp. NPDC055928]|uniref:5-oxoprolinase subunit B family protein n=1 Tax=Pseudarthrobacter sp. NPDC055928 TaxID=3345661 RepID=UPI0035DF4E78
MICSPTFTIVDAGDSALRAIVSGDDKIAVWKRVHALAEALDKCSIPGLTGLAPTYDSVLVEFDPFTITHSSLKHTVRMIESSLSDSDFGGQPSTFRVPVVYGGEHGPDLELVARQLGITSADLIRRHSEAPYTVRCFGSPAGSPMMDGPDLPAPVARLGEPRTKVPSRSVAIAGRQAIIIALQAPSGWPLIGQTPVDIVDPAGDRLTPYKPGDRFIFEPIDESSWDDYAGAKLEADHD